jgi:hypothetical protein
MNNLKETNPSMIGNVNLQPVLDTKFDWSITELENLVVEALYAEIQLNNYINNDWYLALPETIKQICSSTNGQIIYKEQAAAIYSLYTGVNKNDSLTWVKNWNKKDVNAREVASNLMLNNTTLAELIAKLSAYAGSYFFVEKPTEQAKAIHEYLESKKPMTRGRLDVRTLKVGDLTYEYRRLIESRFVDFVEYKTYQRCTVCIVTKAPERSIDGCWYWEAERMSDQRFVSFSVCEDTHQGTPYMYNHKRWDAEIYE